MSKSKQIMLTTESLLAIHEPEVSEILDRASLSDLKSVISRLIRDYRELDANHGNLNLNLQEALEDSYWQSQELLARNEEFEAYADLLQKKNDELTTQRTLLSKTNKRLEEAIRVREEAIASDKSKSAFLSMMSHEIRTPMNGVIGMTSLLSGTNLTPEQREYVNTIRISGDTLLTVINDILDFSKIESGKLQLENSSFEIAKPVEEALELLVESASKKQIDLLYFIDSDVPSFLTGDITRLRQILVNLIGNAVKFTEAGEVLVSIRTLGVQSDTVAEIELTVKDTGIGISPEIIPRLFAAFTQADTTTTRKFGGSGLGLAICRRLVKMMGGAIRAESSLGEGSSFIFTVKLPVARPEFRRYLNNNIPELNNLKVLLIDDSHTNLRILEKLTKTWGMYPQMASSPSKALERLKQSAEFDLLILDWHMPEMDGIQLAHCIRTTFPMLTAPMIMLSSAEEYRTKSKDRELFRGILRKPVKQSELFDTLVSSLANRSNVTLNKKIEKSKPKGPRFDAEFANRYPLRILIAEDNAINQRLAIRLLEKLGYNPDVAGNGIEVLDLMGMTGQKPELIYDLEYDLIFMDCEMPEMDGYRATGEIRKHEVVSGKRCIIIALTANAMEGARKRCLEVGMDDYLTKPISIDQLVAGLKKASGMTRKRS